MSNQYVRRTRGWLTLLGIAGFVGSGRAQTPQVQWQRVVEGSTGPATTTLRAVQVGSQGDYGVLAGKNVVRLSADGAVVWNQPVPEAYPDHLTSRIPVRQTLALAPTPDAGLVILAQDVQNRYYVAKLGATGSPAFTKTIDRANAGPGVRIADNALAALPDGGVLVVGSYADRLSYLTLTKLNREGTESGRWRIKYADNARSSPLIRQVLPTADNGFLLIGSTADGKAVAIKLNAEYNVVWQNTYPALTGLFSAVANRNRAGTYTAVGSGAGGNPQIVTLAPNQPGDGTPLAALPGAGPVVGLAGDGPDNLTLLDAAGTNNGDFRLTNGTSPSAVRWLKTLGGSGQDMPADLLATGDGGYLVIGMTTSTDGDATGNRSSEAVVWAVKLGVGSQARPDKPEPTTANLSVTVLGNPVRDAATVEIGGAEGQSMQLHLLDARGRSVEQRTIGQAGAVERQTFDLRQQSVGTLLLHTTANGQVRTVKIVKQ